VKLGSLYERQFALQLSRARVPVQPEIQHVFAPPRRWRFDFAWPDHKVACEVDGGRFLVRRTAAGLKPVGQHMRDSDYEKLNEAQLLGWTVLRVTSKMVQDGRALRLIERVFKCD
jgi:very-short-patch-repair endonuclease